MHVPFGTAMIVTALVASLVLLVQDNARAFSLTAVITAGIEAAMAFGVLSISVSRFRIDVILPALLVVAGAVTWARASTKHPITAATAVTLIGAMQLLQALRLFS